MKIFKPVLPAFLSSLLKTDSSGNVAAAALSDFTTIGLLSNPQGIKPQGRLSLVTGVPVPLSNPTSTTVYYGPYNGNVIPLWNTTTSAWELQTFTEHSLSTSGMTASLPNDIFASNQNNGTFTLVSVAWSSISARTTGLATQNGMYVKSGSPGQLYLGTVMLDASKNAIDAPSQRWLWNNYNRVARKTFSGDTNSGSYTLVTTSSGIWQPCRNVATTSQISVLCGIGEDAITCIAGNYAFIPAGASMCPGINIGTNGVYSTPLNFQDYGYSAGNSTATLQSGAMNSFTLQPANGINLFTQLEFAIGGTITFFPGASQTGNNLRTGMNGVCMS